MHPTGYDNTTNIDSVKVYNKIEEFLLKMFFTCTQSYKFMPASFTERRAEKKTRTKYTMIPPPFSGVGKDNSAFSTFTVFA